MAKKSTDELLRIYVESQIINYNYYVSLIKKYQADKERTYKDISVLPRASLGGSVIKMPEKNYNSQESSNRILAEYIDEIDVQIASAQKKLDLIDTWLKDCCKTYRQEQMVRLYMIDNQCSDAEDVAEKFGFSEVLVRKTKERVLSRIICKFFS